eukprot:s5635_g11.t1
MLRVRDTMLQKCMTSSWLRRILIVSFYSPSSFALRACRCYGCGKGVALCKKSPQICFQVSASATMRASISSRSSKCARWTCCQVLMTVPFTALAHKRRILRRVMVCQKGKRASISLRPSRCACWTCCQVLMTVPFSALAHKRRILRSEDARKRMIKGQCRVPWRSSTQTCLILDFNRDKDMG